MYKKNFRIATKISGQKTAKMKHLCLSGIYEMMIFLFVFRNRNIIVNNVFEGHLNICHFSQDVCDEKHSKICFSLRWWVMALIICENLTCFMFLAIHSI